MNDYDRRVYEMSLTALSFLKTNKDDFSDIPIVADTVTVLEAETPEIADLGAEKVSTTGDAKDATIHKSDLRDALMDAMRDISDMWKPMAKHHDNAENKFRLPYGSDQLLIDTAGSFIEDATPLAAQFIARGMPADFIAALTAKRDAFVVASGESSTAKLQRIGVNAGFEGPVERCLEAVEDVDPIVKMVYRTNPQKLAEWLVASHVERAAKRSA